MIRTLLVCAVGAAIGLLGYAITYYALNNLV